MTTLVDGLGGEELGDAGDPGSKASQLWITGSVTADSQISGLNLFAGGSVVGTRVENTNGLIESIRLESGTDTRDAAAFGGLIKTGTVTTSAGSAATLTFVSTFTNGSYAMFFGGAGLIAANGSINAYTSGLRRASGCEVIGAAAAKYDYLAVGL